MYEDFLEISGRISAQKLVAARYEEDDWEQDSNCFQNQSAQVPTISEIRRSAWRIGGRRQKTGETNRKYFQNFGTTSMLYIGKDF